MEPKSFLQHRHGVRLTNGVVKVLLNQTFDVLAANFSRRERRLPKYTVVGYAKRNSLAILTPELRVAEGIAHALHLNNMTDQVGKAGAGPPSSDERTTVEEPEAGSYERPPLGQPSADGPVSSQKGPRQSTDGLGKRG